MRSICLVLAALELACGAVTPYPPADGGVPDVTVDVVQLADAGGADDVEAPPVPESAPSAAPAPALAAAARP